MKIWLVSALLFASHVMCFSQVGINPNGNLPAQGAGLDIDFSDKGFLPPRLTTAQRDAISSPPAGLQIFNSDINCMEYYRGEANGWYSMCPLPAIVTTTSVSAVSANSASCGGEVVHDGGTPVIARGVCWSQDSAPTVADSFTSDGTGTGVFSSAITGLSQGTLYYVRAYATNSAGTAYGNALPFTTLDVPALTTTIASMIFGHNATSGGNIFADGGAAVSARGICWSEFTEPTISDNYSLSGAGTSSFGGQLSCLNLNTTYYVRAFATNSVGTAYGNEIAFTTTSGTVVQFTTVGSTNWTVPAGVACGEVLVVGGGGGGGGRSGGGGGGGGVVYHPGYILSSSIPVIVGNGGTYTQTSPTNQSVGTNGGSSVFGEITALGGGGGGSYTDQAPAGGGSGGGGSGGSSFQAGAAAAQGNSGGGTGYGNAGGNGHPTVSPYHSGGGGGAGGMGAHASSGGGGNGGSGFMSSISGSAQYYGGGGGGGSEPGGTLASGGLGGGGTGSNTTAGNGGNASPNTGGGGGGTRSLTTTATGGNGGSGIVIVRY